MHYIKSISMISKISLLFLFWMLASCSSVDGPKQSPESGSVVSEGEEGAGELDENGQPIPPPFVLIENPYLLDMPGIPNSAKVEFAQVKQSMTAKKWENAQGLLNLMAETYPKLAGIYVNLGIVYQHQGKLDEAEKAYQFAIETNTKHLDAYSLLGVLYREQGRFEDAEKTYLAGLAVWPHHLDNNVNLAILYDLYMGRLDDALGYYELSQQVVGGEDRQLKGWIIDLKRRLAQQ